MHGARSLRQLAVDVFANTALDHVKPPLPTVFGDLGVSVEDDCLLVNFALLVQAGLLLVQAGQKG